MALCLVLLATLSPVIWALAPPRGRRTALAVPSPAWSEPIRLTASPLDCTRPVLAVDDATGKIHLAWEQDGRAVLYGYRDAAGWHLGPDGGRSWSGYSPAMALDAQGAPHILYVANQGVSPPLHLASVAELVALEALLQCQIYHRSPLQDWVPGNVSNTSGNSQRPVVVALPPRSKPLAGGTDPYAEVHAAWVETLDGIQRVHHALSRDRGASWPEMAAIAEGSLPSLALRLFQSDAQGGEIEAREVVTGQVAQLWAAWQALPPPAVGITDAHLDILVSHWSGAAWSEPQNVSNSPASDSISPYLIGDAAGDLHLVWVEEAADGLSRAIYYATTATGKAWSLPQRLSGEQRYAAGPRLAAGQKGNVHVAWDAGDYLALRSRRADGSWEAIETIAVAEPGRGIRDVSLAADAEDNLYAAWSAKGPNGEWALFFSQRQAEPTVTPMPPESATPTATATTTSTPAMPTPTATWTPVEQPTIPTAGPTTTPSATGTRSPTPTRFVVVDRWFFPGILRPYYISPIEEETPQPPPATSTPTATATLLPPESATPTSGGQSMSMITERATPTNAPRPLARRDVPQRHLAQEGGWAWSEPANISQPTIPASSSDSWDVTAAVAKDGTVYAVWTERIANNSVLYYSIRSGGEWSEPKGTYIGEDPYVMVAPDGVAHLVYANEQGGKYDIFYCYWQGTRWSPSKNVSYTSGTSSQPAIAAKADGTLIVVWTDTTEGKARLYFGWQVGSLWNTYPVPHTDGGSFPDIAPWTYNRVWVIWQGQSLEDDRYHIWGMGGLAVGNDWPNLGAQSLSDNLSGDALAPRLAGLPSRGAFAVWQQNKGSSGGEVYYSDNVVRGDYWETGVNLSQSAAPSERPAIAAHSSGQVDVAWDEGDHILFTSRHSQHGAWTSPMAIANGDSTIGEVALAAGVRNRSHALWAQAEPTLLPDRDIYHREGSRLLPHTYRFPLLFCQ